MAFDNQKVAFDNQKVAFDNQKVIVHAHNLLFSAAFIGAKILKTFKSLKNKQKENDEKEKILWINCSFFTSFKQLSRNKGFFQPVE